MKLLGHTFVITHKSNFNILTSFIGNGFLWTQRKIIVFYPSSMVESAAPNHKNVASTKKETLFYKINFTQMFPKLPKS